MFDDPAPLLWTAAALFAALSAFAAWRDHARPNRRNLDRPGWVPWTGITVMSLLAAIVALVFAVRV